MRIVLWFLRFKVSWLCMALLIALSVFYVQSCLLVLAAPGKKLRAVIPTANGDLTISADSYTIDPWNGAIAARDVDITSPLGQSLGSATSVSIRTNRVSQWPDSSVIVHLAGLQATIERDKNGLFPIQRYFESKGPAKKGAALEVHLRDANIVWIDHYAGPTLRRTVQIQSARFDQTEKIWRATFNVKSLGDSASGYAESVGDTGLRGHAQLSIPNGAPLLARYKASLGLTQPEAAEIQPDTARFDGSVEFAVSPSTQFVTVATQGKLSVTQLTVAPWKRPISATFNGELLETTIDPKKPEATNYFVRGKIEVRDGVNTAVAEGDMRFGTETNITLDSRLTLASLDELPAEWKSGIAPELAVTGMTYQGPLSWVTNGPVRAGGFGTVARLRWADEVVTGISGLIAMNGDQIAARVNRLGYKGQSGSGALTFNTQTQMLDGHARSASLQLGPLLKPYVSVPISGSGSLDVTFSGKADRLNIELRSEGSGSFKLDKRTIKAKHYQVAATLNGSELTIERGTLTDPAGRVSFSGTANTSTQSLNLNIAGQDIKLDQLDKRLKGVGTAKLVVTGSFEKPMGSGRIEVLGGEFDGQSVPVLVSDLNLSEKNVTLQNVVASRGSSVIKGQLTLNTESQRMNGTFRSDQIQLADWIEDGVVGAVQVESGVIAGTFENPVVSAKGSGKQWVIQNVILDTAEFEVSLQNALVTLTSINGSMGDGRLTARGTYSLDNGTLEASGSATAISIHDIIPVLPGDTLVSGFVGGEFTLSGSNGEVRAANFAGRLADLEVNKTAFGSGPVQVAMAAKQWSGTASVGTPERFIELANVRYGENDKSLEANLTTLGVPVNDLVKVVLPNLTTDPAKVKEGVALVSGDMYLQLQQIEGALDSAIRVTGTIDKPAALIDALSIRDLIVSGTPSGDLDAKGSRSAEGLWTIQSLSWKDGPGTAQIQGTFDEHGDVNVSGTIQSFDPTWLQVFEPSFSKAKGTANLNFEVTGPHESPEILASLDANLFPLPADERNPNASSQVNFVLSQIVVTDEKASIEGSFTAQGITGQIIGTMPFRYPFELPEDNPVDIQIEIPQRGLDELQAMLPKLDLEPLKGTFKGNVHIGGTYSALKVDGSAELGVERIASPEFGTTLDKLHVTTVFNGESVNVAAKGSVGESGSILTNATIRIPNLLQEFDGDFSKFLDSRISGRVSLRNVFVQEPIGKDRSGFFKGEADGDLIVSGAVRQPTISTFFPLLIQGLELQMPGEFQESQPGAPPSISPKFNIGMIIAEPKKPAQVRASTANIRLSGAGKLTGELASLDFASSLLVEDGVIRLPNARIVLDEGGRVRMLYAADDLTTPLRVDVDLEGRTSISAAVVTPNVQRYTIDLRIRGNLLDEESVVLSARSDPPDLSQAQILNLLGQESLVQTLAGQFLGQRDDRQLAGALAGAALPYLLDPVTSRIARDFGLDYLTLEYNAFEGATLTAARTLGGGFVLQGRRQIAERPGQDLLYDYRLTWRSNRGGRTLRSLVFSVGTDQERPYKISVEYGIRF